MSGAHITTMVVARRVVLGGSLALMILGNLLVLGHPDQFGFYDFQYLDFVYPLFLTFILLSGIGLVAYITMSSRKLAPFVAGLAFFQAVYCHVVGTGFLKLSSDGMSHDPVMWFLAPALWITIAVVLAIMAIQKNGARPMT